MASFGAAREAVVCRELTKRFEEVVRGTLGDLARDFAGRAVKGEVVILVDRERGGEVDAAVMEEALVVALKGLSVKDAAAQVAANLGLPRRDVYQVALRLVEGE